MFSERGGEWAYRSGDANAMCGVISGHPWPRRIGARHVATCARLARCLQEPP